MNEKQPYEKHLAEKLQQLPPPGDANRSWPQMRSLLDKDLPEGGGSGFGRNGTTKWWLIGLLVGVITIGTWLSTQQSGPNEKDVATAAGQIASEKETTPSSGVSLPKPNSSVQDQPAQNSSSTDNKQSSNDNSSNTTLPTVKETDIAKKNEGSEEIRTDKDNTNTTKLSSSKKNLAVEAGSSAAIVKSNSTSKNNTKSNQSGSGVKQNDKTIAGINSKSKDGSAVNSRSTGRNNATNESNQVNEDFAASFSALNFGVDKSPSTIGETDVLIKGSPDAQSIASVVPKAPPKPGRRYNKYTKSFEPRSSKPRVVGTGDQKNMAFGLSLPLGFPVGDQQAVAYNFNAGQNTISDYLPAPHFQYHLNDKSFLQSELQFVAPQFIQPVLLSQNSQVISSMQTKYTSIYAKKLYYFNMPFTAYYSPFKHFYLGTGLQFSSMLSGVAMNEEKLYTVTGPNNRDSSISTNYTKFRNDTLSSKFDGSEFRVLFDANYYWQKFTVGLRYNQALTNYISIRATPTSGLFQDRNKAVQFYLRYNFWEDKKKKKTNNLALQ